MDSPHDVSRLIDLAYTWAEDATALPDLLTAVADAVQARSGLLVEHDLAKRAIVRGGVRCRPEVVAAYERQFASIDPLPHAAGFTTAARPGHVFVDSMMVSLAEARSSAYQRKFARPHGCARVLAIGLQLDEDGFTGLAFTRSHLDGPFGTASIAALTHVAPHVLRAWRLGLGLRLARAIGAGALDTLDRRAQGVLLVDRQARVVHANQTAQQILGCRDGLRVRSDALLAHTPTLTARLRALIAEVSERRSSNDASASAVLAVTRPSGRRPWPLIVRPIPALLPVHPGDRVTAVVHVANTDDAPAPSPRLLRELYQLTPAEARVAAMMARGANSSEIAAALGYAPTSAAWYGKRVLAKTGASTRAAFASMVSAIELEPV